MVSRRCQIRKPGAVDSVLGGEGLHFEAFIIVVYADWLGAGSGLATDGLWRMRLMAFT